ncbi:MAG: hypothetical protein JW744_03040 [Candidatus Diapherotrites archaeon]|uniref:Uncharacterized protein n=1 Tax=Candidatus Iainarchaeum sp. TaxID=3101447 RepID=A0A938YTU8_9ARCH|nr:hypothetical protein [Candidatus Diapherotrites archaeon]
MGRVSTKKIKWTARLNITKKWREGRKNKFIRGVNCFATKVKAFADAMPEEANFSNAEIKQKRKRIARINKKIVAMGKEGNKFSREFNIYNAVPEDAPLEWILEDPLSNAAYQLHKCLREMATCTQKLERVELRPSEKTMP